ncbi:MAG: prepilin-type N-terminal cleavage/methylation domain-containing protein [Planctomycetota bacterium]
MKSQPNQGFTLIELIVVVAILAILAGVLVPRVSNHMASARDARRLADVKTVRNAVEQYYMDKGAYPAANQNASYGGWDVSQDGDFVQVLRDEGYLDDQAVDPINDETFHYRYYVYNAGSYGCNGNTDFYVLGVRNFESDEFADKNQGFFQCQNRDWGSEFAYVTGGGASFRD